MKTKVRKSDTKAGKTCKYCGHVIYYSKYHKEYRCMCDRAEPI